MRREALLPVVALSGLAACGGGADEARAGKPNIVILVADDLGWNDVGYHGSEIATPHIDRLAAEGVELDRFYAQPQCTPTRAGLLTGRHPLRFGMQCTVVRAWDVYGMPSEERLLPEMLADAGYEHRAILGKWHLGHGNRSHHPLQHGFTEFYGHYNGRIGYFDHARGQTMTGEPARDWHRGYDSVDESGRYATDLVADDAVRFVREHAGDEAPFFLYVPFLAPHFPNEAPESYVGRYAHLEEPRRTYAAKTTCLDDGIGRILDEIDARGIAEETLVVFLSDNGANPRLGGSNVPLRGGKQEPFEGGLRVPAAVRWPAGLEGGRKLDALVTYLDFFPTLARVVQGGGGQHELARLDGVDVLDVLRGAAPPTGVAERPFFAYGGPETGELLAVVRGKWKLVRGGPNILRSSETDRSGLMLFDVFEDPNERRDLAPSNPAIVTDLLSELRTFRRWKAPGGLVETTRPPPDWTAPKDWELR